MSGSRSGGVSLLGSTLRWCECEGCGAVVGGQHVETRETQNRELAVLARRVVEDVQTIAKDELELAKLEVRRSLRSAGGDAVAILLGGIVALVGLAMACTAAVVASEPLLEALWARLLVFAGIYMIIGGLVAAAFAAKLRGDVPPEMRRTKEEARRTMRALREEIRHG